MFYLIRDCYILIGASLADGIRRLAHSATSRIAAFMVTSLFKDGSLMELLVKNLQVACMFSVFSYFSQILTPSWTYVAAAFASVGSTNPGVLCVCSPGVLCVCMALCLYAVNNTTIIACSHYITVASFDIAFNQHTHLYAMLDTCVH